MIIQSFQFEKNTSCAKSLVQIEITSFYIVVGKTSRMALKNPHSKPITIKIARIYIDAFCANMFLICCTNLAYQSSVYFQKNEKYREKLSMQLCIYYIKLIKYLWRVFKVPPIERLHVESRRKKLKIKKANLRIA